ncbi:MAG: GGDEF domain-containing protein [Acidimicrobiales bacterium]
MALPGRVHPDPVTSLREIRATDTAYRYGGEEFAVLAREIDGHLAMVLAERLRARVEEHFAVGESAQGVTASFGVGLVPPERPIPLRIIASADDALYRSKAERRNRVTGPPALSENGPGEEVPATTP